MSNKISMVAEFQLLTRSNTGYTVLTKDDISSLSCGGYAFIIGGKLIRFDWDAAACGEENGVFFLETGYGPFFNNFEIPDYWDEEYAATGISRDVITAEFLASVEEIDEFYLNFETEDEEECDCGNNTTPDSNFRIKLLKMFFVDKNTSNTYKVSENVLKDFNFKEEKYGKM